MLNKRQLEAILRCYQYDSCEVCPAGDCLTDDIAKTALTLLNMLKRLEYSNLTWEGAECFICAGNEESGHKPDCELGSILREVHHE